MDFLHSFGPGDITCVAVVPGQAYVLNEISNFAISTHFDKIPIRRLGHRLVVGWATGSGTVAGTLVAAQFTQGSLYKLRRHAGALRLFEGQIARDNFDNEERLKTRLHHLTSTILPQQLPPFHLMFVHTNETGQMGIARLYNVVITDVGEVKGASNLFTEETLQFQASFYEQIKLHRSLTVDEMSKMVNKPVGFFNDPRRVEYLTESLAYVSDDFRGEYGLQDGPNVLLTHQDLNTEEIVQGQPPTAMDIADRGHIVYVKSGEGSEAKYLKTQTHAEAQLEAVLAPLDETTVVIPISDTVMVDTPTGPAAEEVEGAVLVNGNDVYLTPLTEEGEPDTRRPLRVVGRMNAGPVELSGAEYIRSMTEGLPIDPSVVWMNPDRIYLDINPEAKTVAREGVFTPDRTKLTQDTSYDNTVFEGMYLLEDAGTFNEQVVVTGVADAQFDVTGSVGPFVLTKTTVPLVSFLQGVEIPTEGHSVKVPLKLVHKDGQFHIIRQGKSQPTTITGRVYEYQRDAHSNTWSWSYTHAKSNITLDFSTTAPYKTVDVAVSHPNMGDTVAHTLQLRPDPSGKDFKAEATLVSGVHIELTWSPPVVSRLVVTYDLPPYTARLEKEDYVQLPLKYKGAYRGHAIDLTEAEGQLEGQALGITLESAAVGDDVSLTEDNDLVCRFDETAEEFILKMNRRDITRALL